MRKQSLFLFFSKITIYKIQIVRVSHFVLLVPFLRTRVVVFLFCSHSSTSSSVVMFGLIGVLKQYWPRFAGFLGCWHVRTTSFTPCLLASARTSSRGVSFGSVFFICLYFFVPSPDSRLLTSVLNTAVKFIFAWFVCVCVGKIPFHQKQKKYFNFFTIHDIL